MPKTQPERAKEGSPGAKSARGKMSDPDSRRKVAEKALEGHPRKAQILRGIDFRNPKASELAIAESLKERARRALGHGSAA